MSASLVGSEMCIRDSAKETRVDLKVLGSAAGSFSVRTAATTDGVMGIAEAAPSWPPLSP
eukprot:12155576-Alexandrium_andersonii.AAC.1